MMNPFNPEAGTMPAPTDPLELELARRSAQIVWRAVPYFGLRYGERGKRFGLSDGAWLITLVGLPAETRNAQVDWLATLLATRGMPSFLLEVQLRVSARVASALEYRGEPQLRDAAEHLASRRRKKLSDLAMREAERRFVAVAERSAHARGTGHLVASALADAAIGVCPSAAPCLDWLRDAQRFAPAFRAAVQHVSEYVSGELARS